MAGHPDLTAPQNKSEFHRVKMVMQQHHNAMHDQAHTAAVVLRKELANAHGKNLRDGAAGWVDRKINALRVARHFAHIAALNRATAKAYENAYKTLIELFGDGGAQHAKSRGFDMDH